MFVHTISQWTATRRTDSSSNNSSSGSTMGSGWRRARIALGLNACASAQPDTDDSDDPPRVVGETPSPEEAGAAAEVSTSELSQRNVNALVTTPGPPSRSSSRLNLIRTSIRLSRSTCAICLESMKPGQGQALFTAECSHTFHFTCIASNVRHGNIVCPVCRAKWKEVPWQAPADLPSFSDLLQRPAGNARARRSQHLPNSRSPITGDGSPEEEEDQRRPDPVIRILDESIANARGFRRIGPQEPSVFDDDEPLSSPPATTAAAAGETENSPGNQQSPVRGPGVAENAVVVQESGTLGGTAEINEQEMGMQRGGSPLRKMSAQIAVSCYPEVCAVPADEERDAFTVLVHLKSSASHKKRGGAETGGEKSRDDNCCSELTTAQILDPSCRAPLDLVTVLDISGSMAGTKLVLLKRAMAFVIRNLSPSDRLSVVAFSSSARRLFPLRRMVEDGRRHALRCVDSLVSTGGTNIADGLRKGAKMLDDRRMRNPVASIMLLSDGQDTYTMGNRGQYSGIATPRTAGGSSTDFRRLLPGSMRHRQYGDVQVPVHTFGFGADHDAATMHSVAEVSGGTFSFIQAEGAVQDAFAQCIGGLLSVVSQATTLSITTAGSGVHVKSIQAGSYETTISETLDQGEVKLGDLYAEEERDILLELQLPAIPEISSAGSGQNNASTVLRVSCSFRDPVSTALCQIPTTEVQLCRPRVVDPASQSVSLEVDRQRNRVRTAQSILEAGHLADAGEISAAQQILVNAKEALHSSVAFQAGDQLSTALETELTEIQFRVANRQIYERTGRAYILSAQSSHFRQRATTRGESTDNSSREYQTASMADMVIRSQTLPSSRSSASRSTTPTRDRTGHSSGRPAMSPSPTRMLLRRSSGRVQDSHGHRDNSPSERA